MTPRSARLAPLGSTSGAGGSSLQPTPRNGSQPGLVFYQNLENVSSSTPRRRSTLLAPMRGRPNPPGAYPRMGWAPEEEKREANIRKLTERKEKAKALQIAAKADKAKAAVARKQKRLEKKRQQHAAATCVQAATRGAAVRRATAARSRDAAQGAAAVRLQAQVRGRSIRAHEGEQLDALKRRANAFIQQNLVELDRYFKAVEKRLEREECEERGGAGVDASTAMTPVMPGLPSWDEPAVPFVKRPVMHQPPRIQSKESASMRALEEEEWPLPPAPRAHGVGG